MPTAATISVSAANAPTGIAGLTMNVTGVVLTNGPCTIAPVSTCMVMGSPGTYRVQLNAPGYKPAELNFTITGTSAGCNTCGHVDTQQLAVTMQPSG
jgi:hypothetical protein